MTLGSREVVSQAAGEVAAAEPLTTPGSGRLRFLYTGPVAVGVWLLIIWQTAYMLDLLDPLVLPGPSVIAETWWGMASQAYYWEDLWATVQATTLGLALGTVAGTVLGGLIGGFATARRAFYPLVVLNQNMPNVAIAPVLLIWLGLGLEFRVIFTGLVCFFPILINFIAAFGDVDKDLNDFMRSLGASNVRRIVTVVIPGALPGFFAGVRVGTTLALIGAIVAEFISPGEGTGSLIVEFTSKIQVPQVFSLILTLGVLGIVLYWLAGRLETFATRAHPPVSRVGAEK